MNKRQSGTNWQSIGWVFAIALGLAIFMFASGHRTVQAQEEQTIDHAKEMKMKITGPFTLAVAGDLLENHPVSELADPQVQGVLKTIQDADAGFANMEANIADYHNPKSVLTGTTGRKADAADVKAMGFKIVSRANNHATENGPAGMFATDQYLDEVGVAHAGTGKELTEAREAQYYESPKGRVGLVSISATGTPASSGGMSATYALGPAGGTPGVNSLRLTMYQLVTQDELDSLRKIRDAAYAHRTEYTDPVPPISANEPKDRIHMSRVGESYKVGTPPGGLSYTMNPEDLREILRSIRNGKEWSDFMIATIHAHEDASYLPEAFFGQYPPDYLVELAHKAIDNGADVFATTGPHVLRGIEIYNGKAIFYGLSSFVKQSNLELALPERYTSLKADPYATDLTDAEVQWKYWDSFARPRMIRDNLDSIVAECKYDKGQLVEIVLHPIELGYNAPLSQKGIPHLASPEDAQRILQKMQTMSKPFGTTITIEGSVGVIRVASAIAQK